MSLLPLFTDDDDDGADGDYHNNNYDDCNDGVIEAFCSSVYSFA